MHRPLPTPPKGIGAQRAHVLLLILILPIIALLDGCAGGSGPLSAMTGPAFGAAMGPGVITPQEQAKYAAQSCPELQQTISGYETGLAISGSNPKAKPGQAAQIETIIKPRLSYLKQLYQTKC